MHALVDHHARRYASRSAWAEKDMNIKAGFLRTGVSHSEERKHAHGMKQKQLICYITLLEQHHYLGSNGNVEMNDLWLDMTPTALIHLVLLYIISSYLTVHIYPMRAFLRRWDSFRQCKTKYHEAIHTLSPTCASSCLPSKGRRHARVGLFALLSTIYPIPGPRAERPLIPNEREPPKHRFA